ncbi:MAG: 4Fe-4S binding protein [Lachnospiraceae bacterium]|nr:4Fe-4S binding protein [Lachnospiraceae bacterium]
MVRKIIKIDEEKCNGCSACARACHEGAIEMVEGKAKLTREDYCDGLGDCLPECPCGAITFEEREAPAYDEAAVLAAKQKKMKETNRLEESNKEMKEERSSQLGQWPCQIKLVPVNAPYFHGAKLLVAADCTAFAYADVHYRYMKGKITLIGCPKLDSVDYSEKLTDIIKINEIKSVTVLRMEVPCCGGLEMAVKNALKASGKMIPWQVVTVSTDGKILEE